MELVKIDGGGSELLRTATELAKKHGGYFVHPHLDGNWTNGYQAIAGEILQALPGCRTLVFPVGGGGLLMGLLAHLRRHPAPVRLVGCEPYNYPKYARFDHSRTKTIADGLVLENPHPSVQESIAESGVAISLVTDAEIRRAMREVYESHALVVEPSSAIALAHVGTHAKELDEPICVILDRREHCSRGSRTTDFRGTELNRSTFRRDPMRYLVSLAAVTLLLGADAPADAVKKEMVLSRANLDGLG